jgi:tetratricopeptide (TPR) repeat protein
MTLFSRLSVCLRLLALTVVIAACSTVPEPLPVPESVAADDYVPDAGYHMLMGEIALQRGDYFITAQEYLAAAQLSQDPDMARRATEYAYEYGFTSYFFAAATRWAEIDPDNPSVHGYLGVAYLKRQNAKQAYVHFDRSMPIERTEGDYLLLEAEMAAVGDAETVVEVLRLFLRNYPSRPGLEIAMATAASRAGNGSLTIASADAVLLEEPDMQRAQLLRARGLMLNGDTELALTSVADLVAVNRELELELEYVRLLANAEQIDAAQLYLDDMSERYGFVPEIVRLSAILSMSDDDQFAAWNDFNTLLSAGFYTNESNYYLAGMAEGASQYLEALRYYSQVRSGPLLVTAQISVAGILGKLGDLNAGIAHLDEVYAQFPQLGFDLWVAKAGLYSRYWRSADAYDAYNRSLEYQPDNINLMLGRAASLDLMGETDRAIAALRQTVKLAPDNANALNSLSYTLANRNLRLREARKLVKKALAEQPNNPAFLDSMGWVLYRDGKSAEALGYLERAYALDNDPEIAAHLGEVLWSLGRDGEANVVWVLALQNSPGHVVLRQTIERYKS